MGPFQIKAQRLWPFVAGTKTKHLQGFENLQVSSEPNCCNQSCGKSVISLYSPGAALIHVLCLKKPKLFDLQKSRMEVFLPLIVFTMIQLVS